MAGGAFHAVGGHQVFVRDEPAADAGAGLPPLLVLHGFPTNSFDFASVLDALGGEAAGRAARLRRLRALRQARSPLQHPRRRPTRSRASPRQWDSPRSTCSATTWVTPSAGSSSHATSTARSASPYDGECITNGVDLHRAGAAHDRPAAAALVARRGGRRSPTRRGTPRAWRRRSRPRIARPTTSSPPSGSSSPTTAGTRCSPARSATSRTGGPRSGATPAPSRRTRRRCGIVWGELDPIAVHAMADRLHEARPDARSSRSTASATTRWSRHPERFAAAVLAAFDGEAPPATM